MPRGEKNKLTEKQRQEIYAMKGTISGYKIAKVFGVTHTTVYKIWNSQAPVSYRDALRRIHTELEKTRGVSMNQIMYNMWINIDTILHNALEIT